MKKLFLPLLLLICNYSYAITADIQASRTDCFSPCPVIFSAEKTTDGDNSDEYVFSKLGYHFNFGDPFAGEHSTTGLSKNEQVGGPIAMHVFRCPSGVCKFSVGVRAQNVEGDFSDAFTAITVHAADEYFTSENTICVSTSGNFSGCPSGATQTDTLPLITEYSNKRVMLRRGEQFAPDGICLDYAEKNILIESFGDPSLPKAEIIGTNGIEVGVHRKCGSGNVPNSRAIELGSRWIENVTINNVRTPFAGLRMSYHNISFVDLDMDYADQPTGGRISLSGNTNNCKNSSLDCANVPLPHGAYVAESTIVGSTTRYPGFNVGAFNCPMINWYGVIDSRMQNSLEHNMRFQGGWRGSFSHLDIDGYHVKNGKSKLTVRGCGIDKYSDENFEIAGKTRDLTPLVSKYVVIANSTFGDLGSMRDGPKVTCQPQNPSANEGVMFCLVEKATFINSTLKPSNDLRFAVRHGYAIENNVYNDRPGLTNHCDDVTDIMLALDDEFKTIAECNVMEQPQPSRPIGICF